MFENLKLSALPVRIKVMITGFLLVMALGYLMCVVNVYLVTNFSINGVIEHYRGTQIAESTPSTGGQPAAPAVESEIQYPKLPVEMVRVSHIHLMTYDMILLFVCLIFLLSDFPVWLKTALTTPPWLLIPLDLGCGWLVWKVWTPAAYGHIIFGALLAVCFFGAIGFSLMDMWLKKTSNK
ncbi:MAG: hypothetical protein HZA49_06135 [Planctomycetes bacterium]|nr:hypothetical protein [Planctomycetota bacterium]